MKKIFAFLLCSVILLTGVSYADSSNYDLNFSFDSGSSCLNVGGVFSAVGNEPVTMVISNYASDNTFSAANPPDAMFMYVTDDNGVIKINEKFSSSFPGGKYRVILTGKNTKYEDYFIFMNPSDPGTLALIDAVNSAAQPSEIKTIVNSDGNAAKLGIDLADAYTAAYLDSALGDILDCKSLVENNAFTPTSFLDMFSKLVAVNMINDGYVDDAMLKYASYFGTTNAQYNTDNTETNSKLEELLKNAEFSLAALSQNYAELLLAARIKSAANWSYMQDIVLGNSEILNIDTSDYNSITNSLRYKVFVKMYDESSTYANLDDVKLSFDAAVKAVIKEEASADDKSSGNNRGGSSGGGSSSITVPSGIPQIVTSPVISNQISFNDISGHFAEENIIALANDGVINGYGDGSFWPEGNITRAEFAKIIAVRFGIDKSGSGEYIDVSDSDWFAPYIYSLSASGIITGYDGYFCPNDYISRQDAAVICMRTAAYLSKNFAGKREFNDADAISDYALEAVEVLAANGIINGDGEKFRPKDNITRGETSAIVYRLFNTLSLEDTNETN